MSAIDVDKLYQIVGQRIQAKRKSSEPFISQAQLAEALGGMERTSITNIEKGIQRAPLSLLYEICAKLELSIDELLPSIEEVVKPVPTEVPPKTAQFIEALKKRA